MGFIIYVFDSVKFFVYIILCATLYMLIDNIIFKSRKKQKDKIKEKFKKRVLLSLNSISESKNIYDEILYIKSKIKIKKYEDVFNDTIIEFNNKYGYNLEVKRYMEYFEDYIRKLIKNYKYTNEMKKAYIIFLLGEYRQDKDYINDFIKKAVNTKSIYLRFNVLDSISKIGNCKVFIEALKAISDIESNINKKIFVDVIGNFKGNMELLNEQLLFNFDRFSVEIKIIITNHYSNNNFKLASNKFLKILNDRYENRELKINILNYFEKVKFEDAKETLILNLNSNEWEFRALAAKALKNYKDNTVLNELLNSITDANWYVRFNSANSLLNFNNEADLVQAVNRKCDKYASEILLYAINIKNEDALLEVASTKYEGE
ncbi:HEAT repeat domain-containing protein [Clostridium sp. Ade.TY]|uniref:HEAT repeat domain-containing protein n=1 Tax=Clostridium sp. Ade.TY TaxID=1391647 RepID=UPI0004037E5B|nr:HEAT repeat domain-containing protein [Clostridium sp. Ade.TY]